MKEQQENKEFELRLQDLLSVFLRCWWVMLIAAAAIFCTVFIYQKSTHEDLYTGTATVYIMKEQTSGSGATTGDISIANQLLVDYKKLLTMDKVLEQVRYELGLNMSISEMRNMVHLQTEEETRFVKVKYTAKKADDAADIANRLASVACRMMNEELYDQPYAKVFEESAVPSAPSNPISKLTILLYSVMAALLVYAIYLVLFLFDDKINSAEDVEKYLGLTTLGQIPYKNDATRKKKYSIYGNKMP